MCHSTDAVGASAEHENPCGFEPLKQSRHGESRLADVKVEDIGRDRIDIDVETIDLGDPSCQSLSV